MFDDREHKIFKINAAGFETLALEIFHFQYENNPVYRTYTDTLGVNVANIRQIEEIPFLPIELFKTKEIKSSAFEPQIIFESSGTSGTSQSRHFVKYISLYEESFTKGFELFYGPVNNYCILCLLPSYLERKNSSLVYMAEKLIGLSEHPQSDFYLYEHEQLYTVLSELEKRKQKTLLLGVTFALLDFAEKYSLKLEHTIVMETGGMKGRREEMTRNEVHSILKRAFSVDVIHSEYGMTELLSQSYSQKDGIFKNPPWMKVLVRDEDDPLLVLSHEYGGTPDSRLPTLSGAINIIDLANVYSCSFIATDDVGKINEDGSFEISGRMDNSDLRGCSLLVV